MSNPVLNADRWEALSAAENAGVVANTMTVGGTVTKTFVLVGIMIATVGVMWAQLWHGGKVDPSVQLWTFGGAIAGFVLSLIGMFAPRSAVIVAPLYAICEGLFLGGITMIVSTIKAYEGIGLMAAVLTMATLIGMLLLYQTGIIKASERFVRGVMIATAGLAIGVGILFLLSMFGIGGSITHALYGSGPIGIGFSIFCIVLAAFNLVVDFGFIESQAKANAPKYMEWVGAMALLVTLVWLYIEILNLLMKLRGGDDDR